MPACRTTACSTTSAGRTTLKEEIDDAEVELSTVLGRGSLSLAELINLKPGDIVPCDFNGKVTVLAEQVPGFPRHLRHLARPAGREGGRALPPPEDGRDRTT